ncbi:hypothetical protein HOE52_03955 [Candidatus Woesearchaeota archaeon]|jgi:hypothetical protein|nr:hypothetical protein [Candidatus Woesearchaeota archaeon]
MTQKISESEFDKKKHVKESKRKCNQCGKVWHSLSDREKQMKTQNLVWIIHNFRNQRNLFNKHFLLQP